MTMIQHKQKRRRRNKKNATDLPVLKPRGTGRRSDANQFIVFEPENEAGASVESVKIPANVTFNGMQPIVQTHRC